jgi:hypothetical protein
MHEEDSTLQSLRNTVSQLKEQRSLMMTDVIA